ncbi:hypothetical protein [Pelotalea chapellei]|uniref:Cbb3-type cytochrome oxidase component FixQ n=1 Tax=Pelotalea chapellei TaxID=44671 RepID=A0ABS5U767_9BACT|nr:hypothetical protein [Pelotalea chapellei]MBT1071510.1 hypothetical protein [Pelotalea chapellei]
MERQRKYDEERELPSPWEWVIITLFSASIVLFGLLVYHLIQEGPRYWDFGQLPDTPAESIYSTKAPPTRTVVPRQMPVLPGSQPLNPAKPHQEHLRERGTSR